jgi:hypothetical protein
VSQLVQVAGALSVLAAFVAVQVGATRTTSAAYLGLNLAGSFVLAVLAAVERQYGFLLLEGAWAVVSAWALLRPARSRS